MTSLPIFLRAAVKITEIDLTQRIRVILSTIGSVVGEFDRGPMDPTYVSGVSENFTRLYGLVANPRRSFAHDTVTSFMTQSSNILIKRVVNAARYSGGSIYLDKDRKRILYSPFPTGSLNNYEERGASKLIILSFTTNPFVTGNVFSMDVTDGATVTSVGPVNFSSNNNQTLTNIASAIQSVINSFGSAADGTARVHIETSSANANNLLIVIRPPSDSTLMFSNAAVSGSSTQPTVNVYEDTELGDVFAENPGSWSADTYGFKLTAFDTGTRERFRWTMSQALIIDNKFNMTINGTPITEVTYSISSDATLAAIATSIQNHPDVFSATVEEMPGATNNDRSIVIVAQRPGPNQLAFLSPIISGGTGQGVVSVSRTLNGIAADHTFDLEVFNRDNVNIPVEQFRVSFRNQISALGEAQNIEYKVNRASNAAINIRFVQSPETKVDGFSLYDPTTGNLPTVSDTINWLQGGDDGATATSADIRNGWATMSDRTTYPFNLMLNAGYTSIAVQQYMTELAEKRSDSLAILDAPSDKQATQVLRNYRLEDMNIDSSYAALYTPDVLIEDINTGENRYIPPSGPVGATYAYSDRLTNMLGAPAGLNRGKVRLALGLRVKYSEGDQELLTPVGINYILDKKGNGPCVFAEETLQVKQTVLSSVHARRILNLIKTGLVDGLEYSLFDPNTEATRFQAVQLGETILKPLKKAQGLYEYRIKCDEDNNDGDVIDADQLAYDVYLKITRVVKGINVRAILTRTGANFDEQIALDNAA